MDAYEEYMMKSDAIDKILEKNTDADSLYLELNKSKKIDIREDFDNICTSIQLLHPQLFNTFIEVLMENGLSDIVMQNIEKVPIKNIVDIARFKQIDEFETYISEDLEHVINRVSDTTYLSPNNIMYILSLGKDQNEIKKCAKLVIRDMTSDDRVEMIQEIIDNKSLGNIEEYLDDLLYIQQIKTDSNTNVVLHALMGTEEADQIKLLEALERNIDNLICDIDENFYFNQISFLDTIKEIEEIDYEDTKQARKLIEKINTCVSNNFETMLEKYGYEFNLISVLRQFGIDNSKFLGVQDKIIEYLKEGDLIKYIQSANREEGFNKEWDSYELTRQMFKKSIRLLNSDKKIDKTAVHTVGKIIEELLEHEGKEIKDIEFAGSGVFSYGIKIGDYILKLGKERHTKTIPNHRRVIKPLIRQDNNEEGRKDIADVTIEIQNFGDVNWYKDLSQEEIEEELYQIYKELREEGIKWTDIKPENVVKLLKPNKENFMVEVLDKDGNIVKQEMKSNNYAIGFTGDEPEDILEQGELVICDTDYIYLEDEPEITVITQGLYYDFEERYISEMKSEKLHEYLKKQIKKSMTDSSDINKVSGEIETAELGCEHIDNDKKGTDRS